MAAEREARRERLSTDVVLQLLLDERSESENESENLSQYQEFIGKVLTDPTETRKKVSLTMETS